MGKNLGLFTETDLTQFGANLPSGVGQLYDRQEFDLLSRLDEIVLWSLETSSWSLETSP